MHMNLDLKNLSFEGLHVLTVGDVMLDQYAFGKVDRISPEAPIPIFSKTTTKSTLGGSGNVSKNISTLGANSHLLAMIGNDKTGVKVEQLCEENKIHFHRILDSNRPTTRKQRFIAKSQQIMRLDEESSELINEDILLKTKSIFDMVLKDKNIDVIIIQDYNKGFLHPSLIKHIIKVANKKNIPTVVDPKFKNLDAYDSCTVFKPNLKELSQAINRPIRNDLEDLQLAVKQLQDIVHFKKAYITLGPAGIYNYQNNTITNAFDIEILDITGAGDSVVSMLALLIATGCEEERICPILNIIGNLSCRHQGAYGVEIVEIRQFS